MTRRYVDLRAINEPTHLCRTDFYKEAKTTQWKKREHLQQMVLVKLDDCMLKNSNKSICIILGGCLNKN